jgi:hypothetical protein
MRMGCGTDGYSPTCFKASVQISSISPDLKCGRSLNGPRLVRMRLMAFSTSAFQQSGGCRPFPVRLQRRLAPSAQLRFDASSIAPAPPPFHRRTGTQPEVLGRLPPGCSGFDCFDHAFTQVLRIWLRHRRAPQNRISALRLAHP